MASRTVNVRLRALIAESGWAYDTVARAVRAVAAETGHHLGTNRSAVHHWISGTVPAPATAHYLAEALSRRLGRRITVADCGVPCPEGEQGDSIGLTLDTDPLLTLATIGAADVNRRSLITASAYSMAAAALPLHTVREAAARTRAASGGGMVGHADVDAVRHMVRMFMDADERHGGRHGRTAFAQYLVTDVLELCRARHGSDSVRREALSVAAAAAQLAGWKAYDSGEHGLAQRYYLQALALARQSGTPGQDAFVMRTMAQQAGHLDHPSRALALAQAAWERARGRVDGQTEALFTISRAYEHARAGHPREAAAGIDQARAALTAGRLEDVPFWGLAWGPPAATVRARTAKTLEALGDHRGAAREYAGAAAARPTGAYARVTALNLGDTARQQLAQGRIEEACATWHRALDAMQGVRSARTSTTVRSVRSTLRPYRVRGAAPAVMLDERARLFLAQGR